MIDTTKHARNLGWLNALLYATGYLAACMVASGLLFIPLFELPSPGYEPTPVVALTPPGDGSEATEPGPSAASNSSHASPGYVPDPPAKIGVVKEWAAHAGILLLVAGVYLGVLVATWKVHRSRRLCLLFIVLAIPTVYLAAVGALLLVYVKYVSGFSGGK